MKTDTEMLDWMIFNSAQVCHDTDGESCWVIWHDRDGSYRTDYYDDSREAISQAMAGNFREIG